MDSLDNSGGADFGAGGADASFGGDISASGSSGAGIGGGNGVGGANGNGIGTDNGGGGSGLSSAGSFGSPGGPAVDLSGSAPGIDYGAAQEAMTNLANGIAAMATLNPLGAIGVINAVTHVGPQVELAVAATLSSDPNVAAQQLAAFAQY